MLGHVVVVPAVLSTRVSAGRRPGMQVDDSSRRPIPAPGWRSRWWVTRPRSGIERTDRTLSTCPLRVSRSCPVFASHTFTVLSLLPVTMREPSGLYATLVTHHQCPLREQCSRCVLALSSPPSSLAWALPRSVRGPVACCHGRCFRAPSLNFSRSASLSGPLFWRLEVKGQIAHLRRGDVHCHLHAGDPQVPADPQQGHAAPARGDRRTGVRREGGYPGFGAEGLGAVTVILKCAS
jgi:hypothetical protein